MSTPQIITPEGGFHNADLDTARTRLFQGNTYKDVSTVCVIPTRGTIPARVLQSWFGLITPMNQKFIRLFMTGMEVGEAYEQAVAYILGNPELSSWKYLLTLEEDNMPPPDGLLKLLNAIESGPYDVVGGLYWTKGAGGQPMCYGQPGVLPLNFIPQVPGADTIQPCNGLGMGFTLFRISAFKDARFTRPWFKTEQTYTPNVGTRMFTQDLYFFEQAARLGLKIACDTRCKVGHYDYQGVAGPADYVW